MRRVLVAAVMVAPFLYMLATALAAGPEALTTLPFGRLVLTSAVVAVTVVVGQVITSATAGYAFARLRFAGRERVFLAYLSALTVPTILLVLPRFLFIDALGWSDRYRGLISTELVSVTGIFLLRQFFRTLPRDLEDAARLEGAGEWTIFWRVIMPQARPALAILAVLAFAEQWRSFLWPLVVAQSGAPQVVEVGMANLRGIYPLSGPDQIAVATAAVLPMVVLYVVAQKYFVRWIQLPGRGMGQS
jgi:multiple sugar transport system permease protein